MADFAIYLKVEKLLKNQKYELRFLPDKSKKKELCNDNDSLKNNKYELMTNLLPNQF